jgi:methylation protein EvaC
MDEHPLEPLPLPRAYTVPGQGRSARRYPARLGRCGACGLIQMAGRPPPPALVRASVDLLSVRTRPRLDAAAGAAQRLLDTTDIDGEQGRVVVVGSTDGYRLVPFQRAGWDVLGVEPAPARVAMALAQNLPSVSAAFSDTVARDLVAARGAADVVLLRNVLDRVADPSGLLRSVAMALAPSGTAILQCRRVLDHLRADEVWIFDPESPNYFTATPLDRLARRHGLVVESVEAVDDAPGRVLEFRLRRDGVQDASILALLADEARSAEQLWSTPLPRRVERWRRRARACLIDAHADTDETWILGASRGVATQLVLARASTGLVTAVADINAFKIGWAMPGSDVPVLAVPRLLDTSRRRTVIFGSPAVLAAGAAVRAQLRDAGHRVLDGLHPPPRVAPPDRQPEPPSRRLAT